MEDTQRKKVMRRIAQVVRVLTKHGLAFLVDELKLRAHLPFFFRLQKRRLADYNNLPRRLRMVMEELGGAYIKMGQVLALRPDLVPEEYCAEFKKLQDRVPSFQYKKVKRIIEQELKEPLHKIFSYVSRKPIGSASVAQVHLAKLRKGQKVVIKVQRPNIKTLFEADIDTMYFIAHRLERKKDMYEFSPTKIVEEVERYSKNELDFLIEGENIAHFYKLFKSSDTVKIPKYHRSLSTIKVLTMEYIDGVKLTELRKVKKKFNRTKIADNIFELAIKQVFQGEIFHADMHPGNFLVLSDNKIALLDFGITGGLSEHIREQGVRLYLAIVDKDPEETYRALVHMAIVSPDADLAAFKEEVAERIDDWEPSVHGTRVTHMLHKLLNSCAKYDLRMPTDVILLGKALMTVEGTCLQLNPDFDFVEKSKLHLTELFTSQWKYKTTLKNLIKKSYDLSDILTDIPRKAIGALHTLETGRIKVDIADEDLRDLSRKIDISSDRIATALVSGSFIVAGALISQVDIGPKLFGIPLLATISFTVAFVMCFFLILSFLKKEKPFIDRRYLKTR